METFVGILVLSLILGLVPAFIAESKGRGFVGWWIYGSLLFLIALIHSLVMQPNREVVANRRLERGEAKRCPDCAELVQAEARVCRYCHYSFQEKEAEERADVLTV